MLRAGGATIRIDPPLVARAATVFGPLAAVLIPEHVWGGLDAHTELTASKAPRCIHDREIEGRVVNARGWARWRSSKCVRFLLPKYERRRRDLNAEHHA